MRNILIITAGRTPQIVTETLYALLRRKEPRGPFVPDEIKLVTTRSAAKEFVSLSSPNGMLAALFEACGVGKKFVAPQIIEVADANDVAVDDVRTEAEAIAFGNCVTRLIADAARKKHVRLHVSLAGGRKTMGWYAGAALSMFGRPQDELSHVLVEPEELEGCPDFWWPTVHDHRVEHKFLTDKAGKTRFFNARDGKVDLALIPFVRLNPFLATEPFSGAPDYQRVVEELDAAVRDLAPVRIRVDVDSRALWVGDLKIDLAHKQFALYALLAEARKKRFAIVADANEEMYGWISMRELVDPQSRHFLRYHEILSACHKSAVKTAEEMTAEFAGLIKRDPLSAADHWRQIKSKITGKKGALQKQIANPRILQQVRIEQGRTKNKERPFGLALDPRQIEFVGPQ